MNVSELTIGSYVKTNKGQIIKIESISTERQHRKVGYYIDGEKFGKRLKYALIDQIEPIPLTGDILKSNGIYYTENFDEQGAHYRKGRVIDINIDPDTMFSSSNIMYVHEIQGLLRLCGLNNLADKFVVNTKEA